MNEDMMTESERTSTLTDPTLGATTGRGKGVFYVHTLGCQMNVHDSERIAGVLEDDGYIPATEEQAADKDVDLIIMNTCAVRENAAERMYGTIGLWADLKRTHPNMQIAIGGCMAQLDRKRIAQKAPWVDAVFGTKNIGSLPRLLDQARMAGTCQVEVADKLDYFPSQLPVARASKVSSWVSISIGCNNTCTFCIVPTTRGKEHDRRPGDILAEIRRCVDEGAKEVTLLGQNVNSFGYGIGDRYAFSKLLRACGDIEGLERVRFTSPHPAAFTDDVIAAMAETPNVMHQLHMPLQSGSDRESSACDASLLPFRQVPGYPAQGARGDAGRADQHRYHRRIPWRDGRGFRGDDGCGASGEVPVGVHIRILAASRNPRGPKWSRSRMRSCRNGSTGW